MQQEETRFKVEEAVLSRTILPLKCFLSKPVSFPKAAQVDRLSIGQVFPGNINLGKEQKDSERRVDGRNSVTARKVGQE